MTTLSIDDIERLFSGAPQFFARSEGHFTGAPHPSVAFPYDEDLEIRDLTDHTQVEDEAWTSFTAWPHIVRARYKRRPSIRPRGRYMPRCRERPNMLSMQGIEKGTMGFQAALEVFVSDNLQQPQIGFLTLASRPQSVLDARRKLFHSGTGLRAMDEAAVLAQLIKSAERYRTPDAYREPSFSKVMGDELFKHILHPIAKPVDKSDPTGLSAQIQALVAVLGTQNVWIDFSRVDWRVRMGELLWGEHHGAAGRATLDEPRDKKSSNSHAARTPGEQLAEERYWLLLQIMLACELLIRLDAKTEAEELHREYIKPLEVLYFEKNAVASVKWALLLARAWLENVQVTPVDTVTDLNTPASVSPSSSSRDLASSSSTQAPLSRPGSTPKSTSPKTGSPRPHRRGRFPSHSYLPSHHHFHSRPIVWLTSLTAQLTLSARRNVSPSEKKVKPLYDISGLWADRQAEGLLYFARKLGWPGIDTYETRISQAIQSLGRKPTSAAELAQDTKSIRPATAALPHAGGSGEVSPALLHPAGWLSKLYLSGLVLPGRCISQLLMGTLVENDLDAMAKIGLMANLAGGLVYGGKSFWSTHCLVGRVIAAGKGAVECMGWISSDVVPKGFGDGWLDVRSKPLDDDLRQTGQIARLWAKAQLEAESHVLGDADPDHVLPADFILPSETLYKRPAPAAMFVELLSLEMIRVPDGPPPLALIDSGLQIPAEPHHEPAGASQGQSHQQAIPPYRAMVRFSVSMNGGGGGGGGPDFTTTTMSFNLTHQVFFVTAHPCVPSGHIKLVKSPTSPTIEQIDMGNQFAKALASNSTGSAPHAPRSRQRRFSMSCAGHPLHKFYAYSAIHLSELLARRVETLDDLLLSTQVRWPAGLATSLSSELGKTPKPRVQQKPHVLVIDCITGFQALPQMDELPTSPLLARQNSMPFNFPPLSAMTSSLSTPTTPTTAMNVTTPSSTATTTTTTTTLSQSGQQQAPQLTPSSIVSMAAVTAIGGDSSAMATTEQSAAATRMPQPQAEHKMHKESQKRQFGSDAEVLVRALCAEKGWHAVISRQRRGCLGCAIREASALNWRVVIRVE